tara:strand:- start:87 stop:434 length:348 start_codon:yes stop_codon:yes gene_type:complete
MAVFVSNLVIEQGFDFETTFELEDSTTNEPLDLTGYTITAQIRKIYTSSTSISLTTEIVDALTGEVKVSLASTETSSIKEGRYVYDIKLVSPANPISTISKAVEGSVLVRGGVTR